MALKTEPKVEVKRGFLSHEIRMFNGVHFTWPYKWFPGTGIFITSIAFVLADDATIKSLPAPITGQGYPATENILRGSFDIVSLLALIFFVVAIGEIILNAPRAWRYLRRRTSKVLIWSVLILLLMPAVVMALYFQGQVSNLQGNLAASESNLSGAENKLQDMSDTNDSMQSQIDNLSSQVDSLTSQLNSEPAATFHPASNEVVMACLTSDPRYHTGPFANYPDVDNAIIKDCVKKLGRYY